MRTQCCHTRMFHVIEQVNVCSNHKCDHYLTPVAMEKEFTKARKALAVTLFSFCLLFTFEDTTKADFHTGTDVLSSLNKKVAAPLTMANVKAELLKQNVLCTDEVLAQVRLESAHLKSFLLKKTNNMFGMRYPAKRPTAACGIYLPERDTIILGTQEELRKYTRMNNYSVYATWEDAIADYKLWQQFNFNVKEKYAEFLGRVYAEDTLYTAKIKMMAKKSIN